MAQPRQGDVFWTDPDPTRGSEQAKSRPFIIASIDQMNETPIGMSLAIPLARTDFSNALHLQLDPPEGGLREPGFAMPEQLRSISHERLVRRLGNVRAGTLEELLKRCQLLLR